MLQIECGDACWLCVQQGSKFYRWRRALDGHEADGARTATSLRAIAAQLADLDTAEAEEENRSARMQMSSKGSAGHSLIDEAGAPPRARVLVDIAAQLFKVGCARLNWHGERFVDRIGNGKLVPWVHNQRAVEGPVNTC